MQNEIKPHSILVSKRKLKKFSNKWRVTLVYIGGRGSSATEYFATKEQALDCAEDLCDQYKVGICIKE